MRRILPLSTILLITIMTAFTYSCQSSKKALENGNYYDACLLAIKKLRSSPNNEKANSALKQAYPLLLQTEQLKIKDTKTLNSPNKYRNIYNKYIRLNNVYQNILTCPAALSIIPSPQSFMNEQNEAKSLALNEMIADADAVLEDSTHTSARKAYYMYGEILKFEPSSELAKEKQTIALEKAIIKVVLEQIPVVEKYNLTAAFFYDQIFTSLNDDRRNQFLEFFRPEEAERIMLSPDHIIRMAFDDFVVGEILIRKTIVDVSKDSVIVGSVEMEDGSKKDVYNTITANFIKKTQTVKSNGLLSIQITDFRTNQILAHEKIEGKHVWENTWGKYRGDSRALTEKQLIICDNEPISPPAQQELFLEFTKPIFKKSSEFLINFYNNSKYAQ